MTLFPLTAMSSIISYGNIFDLCLSFQEHSQGVNQRLGVMCSAHERSPRVTFRHAPQVVPTFCFCVCSILHSMPFVYTSCMLVPSVYPR